MSKDKEIQLEYVPQRTSGDVEAHLLYSRHGVSSISKQTYDAVSDLLKAKEELLEYLKEERGRVKKNEEYCHKHNNAALEAYFRDLDNLDETWKHECEKA